MHPLKATFMKISGHTSEYSCSRQSVCGEPFRKCLLLKETVLEAVGASHELSSLLEDRAGQFRVW